MYENAKPICKNLQQLNPRKETAIKVEVEKLFKDGLFYLIIFIEWGSNPIPIDKNRYCSHVH
jgi:hypothetical protein